MSPSPRLAVLLAAAILALAGCNLAPASNAVTAAAPRASSGAVHGGQQPVSGARILLYAGGTTGDASPARPLLASPVFSDKNGNFTFPTPTCQPGDQLYLTATGGDAGAGNNPAIALITAFGPCTDLTDSTFVAINEVTTVASAFALAPFASGLANVGSGPADRSAFAAAFPNVTAMVSTTSGLASPTSYGNGIVPQTTLYSLANSLAACVNSVPSNTSCADLFSATGTSARTPTNTLEAALNLALNPTLNPSAVYGLGGPTPPFQPTLAAAPASYALPVAHPSDVLTYHNNNARDGVQSHETTLTPANVNPAAFGKLRSFPVDGLLFANLLYAGGVGMPDGRLHNIVLAATTHGSVYAFDVDGHNPASGYLWKVSLPIAPERTALPSDYGCNNPPEAGIVGTPVIDRDTMTVYLVLKTIRNTDSAYFQRIHALSLLDGTEKFGGPTLIDPPFPGTGDGSINGVIPFIARRQLQRAALLLAPNPSSPGKTVWIAFASHCDADPYHGDIVGYNAGDVTQLTATFNDTPNGREGGIWMGAGGMNADASGALYATSGNGTFTLDTPGGVDYGDTVLKLAPPTPGATSSALAVTDSFTPSNQASLNAADLDIGGTDNILFSDPSSGVAPHLLVASDKNGYIYLLNTDNLGKYRNGTHGPDSLNRDVQDFQASSAFIYNLAFFNNTLYISSPLAAYPFIPGTSSSPGSFDTAARTTVGVFSVAPVISANGTADAVVWIEDQNTLLHAYTASLSAELYNSNAAPNNRDTPGSPATKFVSPVIANGTVLIGGTSSITVYGLLQ